MSRTHDNSRDVVVTGLGLVTSLGSGIEFWHHLLAGKIGTSKVTSLDTSAFRVDQGGEIHDFEPATRIKSQDANSVGRASRFAIEAAAMALDDAGVSFEAVDRTRFGVCAGTTSGEPRFIEQVDDCLVDDNVDQFPLHFVTSYPCAAISRHVARQFALAGPNLMIPTACAAGNYSVAHAFDCIRGGRADYMLAGGADAFSRITYTGFARLGAIAKDLCRPFDLHRKGMIPGEGAAMLILEARHGAESRGARIYARVSGYGLSCDAHHMTGPHPKGAGAAAAIRDALKYARVAPDEVDYISAHATGTKASDLSETLAIKQVFGPAASRIPVSSVKSMLGHTMGAASAIESAVCALAVARGAIPPTANWETPDPDCDLDYVTDGAREVKVRVALNNANAFGGNNAAVIFSQA